MANCINKSLPEFKALQEETGLHPDLLAARIGVWQDNNGYDKFPEGEELYTPQTTKDKSAGEVIYYHKNKNFEVFMNAYKNRISKNMRKELVDDLKIVSKDKIIQGKRTILHTREEKRGDQYSASERYDIVKNNHKKIMAMNNSQALGGVQPFIIERLSDSIEKDKKSGKTIRIPNYTIEVNDEFLNLEWERFKYINSKSDEEAENNNHGVFSTQYRLNFWKNEQKSLNEELDLGFDSPKDLEDKLNILQKSLDMARVSYNESLPSNIYGRMISRKGESPLIEINPNYTKKDTAIHEFGHLFVDLLGGMSNNFIKRGRKILEGSTIESEVTKTYGDEISGEMLDKEIITTAIGIEGAKLYDLQQSSPFRAWLKIFFNKVKLALHIDGNVALELAQQMLNNKIDKSKLTSSLTDEIQHSIAFGSKDVTSGADAKINKLSKKVLERVSILKSKYDKNKEDSKKALKFKEEIGKLAKILEYQRDVKGLLRYTDEIVNQSERIITRINAINNAMADNNSLDVGDSINQLGTFIGAFDLIPQVRDLHTYLSKSKNVDAETKKILEDSSTLERLENASRISDQIKTEFTILRKQYLLDIMTPSSKRMRFYYKDNYKREFYKINGGYSVAKSKYGDRLNDIKDRYISDKLAENADEIKLAERNYIERILDTAPKDIEFGLLGAFAVDPRSMDDSLIAYAVKLLDKADYIGTTKFIKERNIVLDLHNELYDYMGKPSDQLKLYDGIYEKINGKKTNHLVGKYLSSFKEARNKWYSDFEEEFGRSPNKSEIKSFYVNNKSKYENPQYKQLMDLDESHPKRKVYDYLITQFQEKDKITPPGYSLNLNLDSKYPTFKLPTIESGVVEALYSHGLSTSISQKVRDTFSKNPNDRDFGEVITEENINFRKTLVNESGKENHTIPIHYRGTHKNANKQSFDILGIHLIDHMQLVNYQEKSKVGGTLELIAEQAGIRNVVKRKNGKTYINAIMGKENHEVDLKGNQSAIFKTLNSILEDRLYGISTIDAGDIKIAGKTININKGIDGVLAWTGHTMLMLNYLSGSVNLLQGKYQNFLEASGGGIYNKSNVIKAEKLFAGDFSKNMLYDIGLEKPTSKTNLFIEKFNAFADFSGLKYSLAEDNRVKRLTGLSAGHIFNHSAEYYIQGTLMYAVLDSIKVNLNGKIIPLHEAYELKNGELVSKLKLSEEELKNLEFETSAKIQETIKILHGNYNKNNQAMAQRHAAGKLGYMLRKWMIPGIQRRYRGLQYINKGSNRTEDDIAYSDILDRDMEGYYTTSLRFLYSVKDEIKAFEFSLISAEWNLLTDEERGNIRKTIIDMATMAASIIAASLLAGLAEGADDDDKEMYYTAAYLLRRHYSELRFYSHPGEALKILSTPAASLMMVKRISDIFDQLLSPTERYVRGKNKGELKILRKTGKALPVFGVLDRNIQDTYKWMTQ